MNGINRRTLIIGAAAAGLTAACGQSGTTDVDDSAASSAQGVASEFEGPSADLDDGTYLEIKRFPQTVLVPGEVRLPHSLQRDAEFINDGPLTLGAQVVDLDGVAVGPRLEAERRDVTPSSYYVWTPMIESPGIYSLVVDGADPQGSSFQVFAPDDVTVPLVGSVLQGFDTPTIDDPAGVDPICTREPACPFHSITLSEALDDERGVVYLMGTPAFCQTGTCTPALETLIDVADELADDFVFVHAEVYTDLTATTLSPAIQDLGMEYEPVLFVTDGSGVILHRLDAIWNDSELNETLAAARP